MITITLKIPKELSKSKIDSWEREQWLKTLREYKQDQEDMILVENEKKERQNSVSLEDYLKKCGN